MDVSSIISYLNMIADGIDELNQPMLSSERAEIVRLTKFIQEEVKGNRT